MATTAQAQALQWHGTGRGRTSRSPRWRHRGRASGSTTSRAISCASGELQRMIEEDGLRGMTSNPTIFQKAIAEGDDYDEQIERLIAAGQERRRDLRGAGDQGHPGRLRPLPPALRPHRGARRLRLDRGLAALARDTQGTIDEARRLWNDGRPPERDGQGPGHRRGRAGDRAAADRGHQHQHHPALLARRTTSA